MVTTMVHGHDDRMRSYGLLAGAMGLPADGDLPAVAVSPAAGDLPAVAVSPAAGGPGM
jgi:hypothetical protein